MTKPTSLARDSSRWDRKAPGNVSPTHLAAPQVQCSALQPKAPWRPSANSDAVAPALVELLGNALEPFGRRIERADDRIGRGLRPVG